MNYKLILKLIGRVLRVLSAVMLLPAGVSLFYGGDFVAPFVGSSAIAFAAGQGLTFIKAEKAKLKHKEGFAAAAFAWAAISAFGALPFYFSGHFNSYFDCFFEAVSGFTTTGATVLSDVELLPHALQFWRALTQWLGGMGVIVLIVAISGMTGASAINLIRAETTGPLQDKVTPRTRDMALFLYILYVCLTAALFLALLFAGMPVFDAAIHALGTAGTGGSSPLNAGLGGYGAAARWVVFAFMIVFGANYTLAFTAMKQGVRAVWRDEELRLYLGLTAAAAAAIAVGLRMAGGGWGRSIEAAAVQSASFITTTGYYTADFRNWPAFCRNILLLLMLIGGCAGSTSGGMKVMRVRLLFKAVGRELSRIVHPRAVKAVSVNGRALDDKAVNQLLLFFAAYGLTAAAAAFVVSFDIDSLSAGFGVAVASISNIGPGFGVIGPGSGYGGFSYVSKAALAFCMLAGRLEFYPLFAVFMPSMWRSKS